MRAGIRVFLAALLLAGCVQSAPTPPGPAARYNAILGQAAYRRGDGVLASCAGGYASLLPVNHATRSRLNRLYGEGSYVEVATAPHLPHDPAIERLSLRARCDARGRFRFAGLADGAYYVVAPLRALGEGAAQGGSAREQVTLRGGETREVTLTR